MPAEFWRNELARMPKRSVWLCGPVWSALLAFIGRKLWNSWILLVEPPWAPLDAVQSLLRKPGKPLLSQCNQMKRRCRLQFESSAQVPVERASAFGVFLYASNRRGPQNMARVQFLLDNPCLTGAGSHACGYSFLIPGCLGTHCNINFQMADHEYPAM